MCDLALSNMYHRLHCARSGMKISRGVRLHCARSGMTISRGVRFSEIQYCKVGDSWRCDPAHNNFPKLPARLSPPPSYLPTYLPTYTPRTHTPTNLLTTHKPYTPLTYLLTTHNHLYALIPLPKLYSYASYLHTGSSHQMNINVGMVVLRNT